MIIFGIDPGVATGVAILSTDNCALTRVAAMPIHRAMEEVRLHWEQARALGSDRMLVVFEDARKRRVFDQADRDVTRAGAARREGAGSAKRDAKIWEDFLTDLGVPWVSRRPAHTKYGADYFRAATGWTGKTNEHGRDAGMLVAGYNLAMAQGEITAWKTRQPAR